MVIIKYIPLQQGLRHQVDGTLNKETIIIKYIPLQQGLRLDKIEKNKLNDLLLSIFHYNKD